MGLFDRLFGKNKKEQEEIKERRALGLKDEVPLTKSKTEVKPTAAETKPAEAKKAAPKATEAKPTEAKTTAPKATEEPKPAEAKKAAPKATEEPKPAEAKKAAPKATEAKPAEAKKAAPKATGAKPAEAKKAAPKATEEPKPAEAKKAAPKATEEPKPAENTAEGVGENAEVVELSEGATGRFEIKKSKDGRFVFNLYAKNHVIVATSQVYSSSTSAVNGIKSVITNAPIAPIEDQTLKTYEPQNFPKWEIYQDKGGQYRFRLSAPNGSCICHSQGYTNKTNCKNGIQSIIRSAKDASIDKIYLKKDKDGE